MDCDGDDGRSCNSRMDCGDYQKDNRWLGSSIVMELREGIICEGWIVVNNQKDKLGG